LYHESNGEDVHVVATPLPATVWGVRQEEEVVHFQLNDLADEIPDGGALADGESSEVKGTLALPRRRRVYTPGKYSKPAVQF
jgi:hypothetical protein